ncbi:MAG: protein kinase domain-containing protein, partial [Actinomycetes bacterium]
MDNLAGGAGTVRQARGMGGTMGGSERPGLDVPGFEVVELLGYGSEGEVWLAREHASGAPVALKRVRGGSDLAARDRLRREAAVLAGVDHPHIVRLRSVVGAGDDLVLVLDLATGGSLARLLASRRLSPGEVVTIAVPLAQALADVHSRGLVHGDVTPANVLF